MKPPSGPKKNKPKTNPISSKAKIACRKIWPHHWTKKGRCFLAIYIEYYILVNESLL
jgi:hypothetical protein